jgi:hypothetical protein
MPFLERIQIGLTVAHNPAKTDRWDLRLISRRTAI